MRNCPNHDLKVQVEEQRPIERRQQGRSGFGHEMAENGYATLDQAENGTFTTKERRGLTRDANFPRRY